MKAYFEEQFRTYLQNRYSESNALYRAIQYSTLNGGKRLRAQLSLYLSEHFGGSRAFALQAAYAVEMIHAYSLIHDDLPCMDNDDLRRGVPTSHKVFGESTALLAGDALLTDAMELLSNPDENAFHLSTQQRLDLVRELSAAIGSRGMVLGQWRDMENVRGKRMSLAEIDQIHNDKTGKLIAAACTMGAICAGADCSEVASARQFGLDLGLAFQIQDDLLDASEKTGKTAGKDADLDKSTYLSTMHIDDARRRVTELFTSAMRAIGPMNSEFQAFLDMLMQREH